MVLIERNPTVIPEQKAPVIVQTVQKDYYERPGSNFAKTMDLKVYSSHVLILLRALNAIHRLSINRECLPAILHKSPNVVKILGQFYLGWKILNKAKLVAVCFFCMPFIVIRYQRRSCQDLKQKKRQQENLLPFHMNDYIQFQQIWNEDQSYKVLQKEREYFLQSLIISFPLGYRSNYGQSEVVYEIMAFDLIVNNMNQLRQNIIAQTQIIAKKTRFGLFSQPPPIALGDSSFSIQRRVERGENGKPKTLPRNMLAGPNRSGVGRKAFIVYPASIYQKDPYKQPAKIDQEYRKKIYGKANFHESDFCPASGTKTITNSAYQHVQQKQQRQKKVKRDENGRVRTDPSNIITNCMSRIKDRLFKHPQHMKDEYERPREISKQQRIIWRQKIKQEVMFRSVSHGGRTFSKDKIVYGLDEKSKSLLNHKIPIKSAKSMFAKHDTKFKLARRGHGDPLGRYPEFIEPQERRSVMLSRRTKTENIEAQKETWRPNSGFLSKPSPSINLTNIRKFI